MKKLILLLLLFPSFIFGQGIFLKTEIANIDNGDSLVTGYYMNKFSFDYGGSALRFDNYTEKELFTGGDTLLQYDKFESVLPAGDSVQVGGSWYSPAGAYNQILSAGNPANALTYIKLLNIALIDKYPMKKYSRQ